MRVRVRVTSDEFGIWVFVDSGHIDYVPGLVSISVHTQREERERERERGREIEKILNS